MTHFTKRPSGYGSSRQSALYKGDMSDQNTGNSPKFQQKFSLALGGGGAKGLAHIPLLEVLDKNQIEISAISGTSIGAVIGAFYACGMKGRDIREIVLDVLTHQRRDWITLSKVTRGRQWYHLVGFRMGASSLLALNPLVERLAKHLPVKTFEDLQIPLQVVAANFWERTPHVFSKGDILPALQASVSIAGLFEPILMGSKVLVDGGAVNPVPFDLLPQDSFRLAFDVLGKKTPPDSNPIPRLFESMFNTYQIMEETIVNEKLKQNPPNIYVKPHIPNVRVMEFNRFEEIFALTKPAENILQRELDLKLNV